MCLCLVMLKLCQNKNRNRFNFDACWHDELMIYQQDDKWGLLCPRLLLSNLAIEGGEHGWILPLRRRWNWFNGSFAELGWNVAGSGLDSALLLVTSRLTGWIRISDDDDNLWWWWWWWVRLLARRDRFQRNPPGEADADTSAFTETSIQPSTQLEDKSCLIILVNSRYTFPSYTGSCTSMG